MRKVVVPEDLMNMITAMCDVLIADGRDDVATRTAREIRKEIDKGLEYGVETLSNNNIHYGTYKVFKQDK